MKDCDVCGRKSDDMYLVDIEGAQMMVCAACAEGKEIIKEFSDRAEPEQRVQKKAAKVQSEVVEDYGNVIRKAREALGIPTKVLAEKINEKESTLIRVEKGEMLPDDRLVKRLETALGIKLVVAETAEKKSYSSSRNGEVTFGDSVIIKDKKGKGS